jgi:hypothetical protein
MLCVQSATHLTVSEFSRTYDRCGSVFFAVFLESFAMLVRVDSSEARPVVAVQRRQGRLLLLDVRGKLL